MKCHFFFNHHGTSEHVSYSRGTDNAENTVPLLHSADHTENTSHMITKHCWDVTSLCVRGSVFTEQVPRSRLHNPVVPLFVHVLETAGYVAQPFLHGASTPRYAEQLRGFRRPRCNEHM
jgi:hypothetical protein